MLRAQEAQCGATPVVPHFRHTVNAYLQCVNDGRGRYSCGVRTMIGRVAPPAAALLLAALLAMPALAQTSRQPDAYTPVEEFSRQLEAFKKTIPELNKKIEDSAAQ